MSRENPWQDVKDQPTKPWVEGNGNTRGEFSSGKTWDVVEVWGSNGALVCDVRVLDSAKLTAAEQERLDVVIAAGR